MQSKIESAPSGAELPDGQKAVDLVVYLASLVSELRAIDDMLDPVREITARMGPDKSVSPGDQKILEQVCGRLQNYLTTQEKLRSFTPEQLQERIADFTHGTEHRSMRRTLGLAAAITLPLVLAVIALPLPLTAESKGLTASSLFFMMIHLTAAWFFIGALRTFAPTLRQAYFFIAGGVAILGLTQIVQPVVHVLGLQSTPYNTLFSVLPLIPSYLLMYEGSRRFAMLLHRETRWLQPVALLCGMMAAIGVGMLLPHGNSMATGALLDIILSLQIVNITVVVAVAAILVRVIGSLTSLYARPVRLLFAFAVLSIGIGVYMLIVNALTGGVPPQILLVPLIIAIVVNGFILLGAGYDFKRASLR